MTPAVDRERPVAYKEDGHGAGLPVCVASLYQFAAIAPEPGGLAGLRQRLGARCMQLGVMGTLLLAREGINGTLAGDAAAIAELLEDLRRLPGCADLQVKYARAASVPFHRMKVRVKREIVTMGCPDLDPLAQAGAYVAPQDWNALITAPGTILIDTRNEYEVALGSFAGAIDPGTRSFRDFPNWFRDARASLLGDPAQPGQAPPKIAMFCTGGIRCEKATALLKAEGLEAVYHLAGGILNYLETVPPADSLWQGECFVFDQRVSVSHGLAPGTHGLCHACRRPVSAADRASPAFEAGVACPACRPARSDEQRAGYRERHRQEVLAAARGGRHIGSSVQNP